jgi:uncharacterized membrane protein YoaK (UPF0700 family)
MDANFCKIVAKAIRISGIMLVLSYTPVLVIQSSCIMGSLMHRKKEKISRVGWARVLLFIVYFVTIPIKILWFSVYPRLSA